jgi:hypothetical protein
MGRGAKGFEIKKEIDGVPFYFEWGSKVETLPFSVYLRDFQLERYPGSMSPSSYASEVTVIDEAHNVKMPYRIYMNHVLDYGGYRLFQSSYDMDELGTVLSVNKDPGKWPTYIGYIMLGLGFLLNILNPKSRFRTLARRINEDMKKSKDIIAIFIVALFFGFSTNLTAAEPKVTHEDLVAIAKKFDKNHAEHFATILTQSSDGRIMPIDTLSDEILNKVSRKTSLYTMTPNQVVIGMMTNPKLWQNIKMIKVFHPKLKKLLGMSEKQKYAAFNDFFTHNKQNPYLLAKYAEVANRKKPASRNKFDKDVLKVDERLNICYMVYSGSMFRIFPKKDDPNKKWYDARTAITSFPPSESKEVRDVLNLYFDGVEEGFKTNNWSKANEAVDKIVAFQKKYGANLIPPK